MRRRVTFGVRGTWQVPAHAHAFACRRVRRSLRASLHASDDGGRHGFSLER